MNNQRNGVRPSWGRLPPRPRRYRLIVTPGFSRDAITAAAMFLGGVTLLFGIAAVLLP